LQTHPLAFASFLVGETIRRVGFALARGSPD
jgi:hypothetical protein